jgi:hypothetical protein
MVEIIGSTYCHACYELMEILLKKRIKFKFHDAFTHPDSPRCIELKRISDVDGYIRYPIAFYDGECIGDGVSVIRRIEAKINE